MYSVFFDILGFSNLVESVSDDDFQILNDLIDSDKIEQLISKNALIPTGLSIAAIDLITKYSCFQREASRCINLIHEADVEIIAFSDSMFVQSNSLLGIIDFSKKFIHRMYNNLVAIRGGISNGVSASLQKKFTFEQRKSFYSLPIFGTSIVNSFNASLKLKGLRIFISLDEKDLTGKGLSLGKDFLKLTEEEVLLTGGLTKYELNFLDERDIINSPDGTNSFEHRLEVMRENSKKDSNKYDIYYIETHNSLVKMKTGIKDTLRLL
jgi:hypothetical protein